MDSEPFDEKWARDCADAFMRSIKPIPFGELLFPFVDIICEALSKDQHYHFDGWRDLRRARTVAEAYHNKLIAADFVSGHCDQIPNRPGMASANALGTLFCGGEYCRENNGKFYIPSHEARPQDAGKQWLWRLRRRYREDQSTRQDKGFLGKAILMTLLATLP